MGRCVARTENLERCPNSTENGSIFCRRHRLWWLITLVGAIVTITTIWNNILSICSSGEGVFEASKCPPKIGNVFHSTVGAKVWSQPDVSQGTVTKVFQEKTEVFVLDGPISGPVRSDNPSIHGNWWKISLGKGRESIGWIWEGRFDECQP